MIFVTVGSQLPFDRLIKAVDEWAGVNKDQEVVAQIGISLFRPKNITFFQTLTLKDYTDFLVRSDFIVSHAGMGTIISALEYSKPLLLMARLESEGEHRNDHQVATSKRFSHFSNIKVADDERKLQTEINRFLSQSSGFSNGIQTEVSADLIGAIRSFVNN